MDTPGVPLSRGKNPAVAGFPTCLPNHTGRLESLLPPDESPSLLATRSFPKDVTAIGEAAAVVVQLVAEWSSLDGEIAVVARRHHRADREAVVDLPLR